MLPILFETLDKQQINVANLTKKEEALFKSMLGDYEWKRDWIAFKNHWHGKLRALYKDIDSRAFVKKALYRIYQDLASRLGVQQHEVRLPDYRDKVLEIIEREYKSRYAFCKQLGIDEGFLSNIKQKKKHFSMDTLQHLLAALGYELRIEKLEKQARRPSLTFSSTRGGRGGLPRHPR